MAAASTSSDTATRPVVTIVGAGLAGTLMAILLARRDVPVLLLERRPDPRIDTTTGGRSINLALADRGIAALKAAGVFAAVEPLLIPMPGRMLHDTAGAPQFIRYGQNESESIYSVSRSLLNCTLLDELARLPNAVIGFSQECQGPDFGHHMIRMRDTPSGNAYRLPLERVIAADGAGSPCRHAMAAAYSIDVKEEMLAHGYKELTLPADASGNHQFDPHALHIWPRGNFMLIALPNLDGTFTVTLFLPHAGPASFASLKDERSLIAFFEQHFADALELMPDLAEEFASHPTGHMGTVYCDQWSADSRLVLLGDAAHAIVPFHGQGMNCAFEDCAILDDLLAVLPWPEACDVFASRRKPDTDAIAGMAIENYLEMRDTVRAPRFQLQKALSLELERRFPERFIPRYSMVMFHHEIPYRVAMERGQVQSAILSELTQTATDLSEVDYEMAQALIEASLPLLA
ncbi:MAG: NAD(P)/FAD-dependent oxidoreductase [Steroidobacteraceae bacterium]